MAIDIGIKASMLYSSELYRAIEAYADDRKDRTKYDAILEAAAYTVNKHLLEVVAQQN